MYFSVGKFNVHDLSSTSTLHYLHRALCTLCSVHYTLSAPCTICTLHYALSAMCTMHYLHLPLSALCTMQYTLCTISAVHYALCTMHYVLCTGAMIYHMTSLHSILAHSCTALSTVIALPSCITWTHTTGRCSNTTCSVDLQSKCLATRLEICPKKFHDPISGERILHSENA